MAAEKIRAACTGQTPYLSWSAAHKSMSRHRFDARRGRGNMNIYRCRYCAHWHIGRSA